MVKLILFAEFKKMLEFRPGFGTIKGEATLLHRLSNIVENLYSTLQWLGFPRLSKN